MKRIFLPLVATLIACSPGAVNAQSGSTSPEDEYAKLIRVSEEIAPLGETPFGENLSLYNGTLSFHQTDISASGTGPLLELTRSFHTPELTGFLLAEEALNNTLVDWNLELPRIETLVAEQRFDNGPRPIYQWWFLESDRRCTGFSEAPDITVSGKPGTEPMEWFHDLWWRGYQLIIPGAGSQDLLRRDMANGWIPTISIEGSAIHFPAVTKQKWAIGCLPKTSNGRRGEGFIAISPDGMRYWLDWLIDKPAMWMGHSAGAALKRRTATMLVSKIEDRFGNRLAYTYDGEGNLTTIQGSDGREVKLDYDTWNTTSGKGPGYRLRKVTLQPSSGAARSWTYSYSADASLPRLTGVILPDGSSWSFNLGGIKSLLADNPTQYDGCTYRESSRQPSSASMRHPSGLEGTFTFRNIARGRSYVPKVCLRMGTGQYLNIPHAYPQTSLVEKIFSGAGLVPQKWVYTYSPTNQSWASECAGGCASTVWSDVTDPAGSTTRYSFSNRYDATESLLLNVDQYVGAPGTTLLRSEFNSYQDPGSGPWPSTIGSSLRRRLNSQQIDRLSPLGKRVIKVNGDEYTWQATAFDIFAQPTAMRRYNNIAGQSEITEGIEYFNDTANWVLGLPKKVSNLTNGETISRLVYEPNRATLAERYSFEHRVASYTFDGQGGLTSFSDGNGNTTRIPGYDRGIPRSIVHTDGTTQHVAVTDFGQVASITDQAGHTTRYGYDAMGRIAHVIFPEGDSVGWAPKLFNYEFVGPTRGIAGNHWRRVTRQGDSTKISHFDALWRPIINSTYRESDGQLSSSMRTDYDWRGRQTFSSYPMVGTPDLGAINSGTSTNYDPLGRVVRTTQTSELGALTTYISYLSGARKQVTNPGGSTTHYAYQVFDEPKLDAIVRIDAPEGISQTVIRDAYGNPTSVTQAGGGTSTTKTIVYDATKRLCRITEPESGSEVMAFDAANNMVWNAKGAHVGGNGCGQEQIPDSVRTNRRYDNMSRVTAIVPPPGTESTAFTYDPAGNIATLSTGPTVWTQNRNKRGLLSTETLAVDGYLWTLGYNYSDGGALSSLRYPDGRVLTYQPDALGRPTRASDYVGGVSYFPDNEVQHAWFGNGADYLAQKNERNVLRNYTYAKAGNLSISDDLVFDALANVREIVDLAGGGRRSRRLAYDGLSRLTSAASPNLWGTENYTYDALNNISSISSKSGQQTFHYNARNLLASVTSASGPVHSFQYDERGNVTEKNGILLSFDDADRLKRVIGKGSYLYDGFGKRVRKTLDASSSPTYHVYSGTGKLMFQYVPENADTGYSTDFLYLGDRLFARDRTLVSKYAPTSPASITTPPNATGPFPVHWTKTAYTTNYNLEQQRNSGPWTVIYTGESLGATVSPPGSGAYLYRINACNGAGCSESTTSSKVDVTFPPASAPLLQVPSHSDSGIYALMWTVVEDASKYTLEEQLNGAAWRVAAETEAMVASLSGRPNGTNSYRVRGCNIAGCGPWSSVQAIGVAIPPPIPQGIQAHEDFPNPKKATLTIVWRASAGATRYEVREQDTGNVVYTGLDLSVPVESIDSDDFFKHSYGLRACNEWACTAWLSTGIPIPPPPKGKPTISAPVGSDGNYTVTWSSVLKATGYNLQEQTNGGSWTTVLTGPQRSWIAGGKSPGNYGYRAQACNATGCGFWSDIHTLTVAAPPPPPTNVHAIEDFPNPKRATLTIVWNPSVGVARYEIKEVDTGNIIYSGLATSVLVESVVFGESFRHPYAMRACNNVSCTQWLYPGIPIAPPPKRAPSISAPGGSSDGAYVVSWGNVESATSFTLQEQVNGGGWSTILSANANSWVVGGKGQGAYGYQAQGCNRAGCGPWSKAVSVVVALVPPPPTGVYAQYYSPNPKTEGYRAVWNAVPGATRYEGRRLDTGAAVWSGTATTFGICVGPSDGLCGRGDRSAYFNPSVRACNATGCSAWAP
jgi:YD repeat-containing protein